MKTIETQLVNGIEFPVFDLTEKYKEEEIKFLNFKSKIKGFTEENSDFNLKINDTIKIIGGYAKNIVFKVKILGFDGDGDAYVSWDCYWFPVKLSERLLN